MQKYANSQKRKRIAQLASLAAIVVMIYPTMTFIKVLNESGCQNDYSNFVKNEIESNNELWFQKGILDTDEKIITLYFNGEITEATEADLQNELKDYENISDYTLNLNGNKNRSFDKISDAYDRAINDIDQKSNIISGLQKEIENLRATITELSQEEDSFPFAIISKDAKIKFPELESFGFAETLISRDFSSIDTLDIVTVRWKSAQSDSIKLVKNNELKAWVKTQINTDTLVVQSRMR